MLAGDRVTPPEDMEFLEWRESADPLRDVSESEATPGGDSP
jgi:hypothetical protein